MVIETETSEPLLGSLSNVAETSSVEIDSSSMEASEDQNENEALLLNRSTENDVLLETAVVGRHMSWTSAWFLMISRMVGSGIFASPGTIASSVGSIGLSLSLWLVGAGIAACSLAIALEYGCMLPRSGGEKVYLEYTYPKPRFFVSTLFALHAIVLVSTASNCILFGEYTLFAFGADGVEATGFATKLLAIGLLTTVTIIHGCFLRTGVLIQNTLAGIKIVLMAFLILTGFWAIMFRPARTWDKASHFSSPWDRLWAGSIWNLNNISLACLKIYYSFSGFTQANQVLNEVKDPVRTLKTAAPAALLTVCVMYLFVTTFTIARVDQEVARQGLIPFSRYLASSYPFNAPLGGLLVHFVVCSLIITLPPSKDAFAFILDVEGYSGQFLQLAVAVGLLLLRRTRPNTKRPFKAWKPAVWLRVGMCLLLIMSPFITPKDGKGDVSFWYGTYALITIGGIILVILSWYIWTILLPRRLGYSLEENVEVLSDGTNITVITKRRT